MPLSAGKLLRAAVLAAAPLAHAEDVHQYFERQRMFSDGYIHQHAPPKLDGPNPSAAAPSGRGGKLGLDCGIGRTSFKPGALRHASQGREAECGLLDSQFENFLREFQQYGGG